MKAVPHFCTGSARDCRKSAAQGRAGQSQAIGELLHERGPVERLLAELPVLRREVAASAFVADTLVELLSSVWRKFPPIRCLRDRASFWACAICMLLGSVGMSLTGAAAESTTARTNEARALRIGLLMDFSSGSTEVLKDRQRAFELAIEHVNEGGGVFGLPVTVAVGDTTADPEKAVAAARHLVEVGRRSPIVLGHPLDLEEVGSLCARGQIGDAHLVDHPLAQRATLHLASHLLGHHRSPLIMTASRRTVPTAGRRRSRC